jgi:hypothetical protein
MLSTPRISRLYHWQSLPVFIVVALVLNAEQNGQEQVSMLIRSMLICWGANRKSNLFCPRSLYILWWRVQIWWCILLRVLALGHHKI